jgi:tetratricopeptide (TPR) repeat protein
MRPFKAFLKTTSLALALAAVGLVASPAVDLGSFGSSAFAQQDRVVKQRPPQRVAPQVTPAFFKLYEAAQEAMAEENYTEAMDFIEKMITRRGFNDYERSIALQLKGSIYYEQDNIPGAIRAYEAVLASSNIPYRFADSVRYTLAQFYAIEDKYQKSLDILLDWLQYQPDPRPSQWHYIGQTYYQLGLRQAKTNKNRALESYRKGIPLVETAINIAKADPEMEVRENWYEVQLVLYYELSNYAKVRDILEVMIIQWPRARYWVQLSAMYSELREDEKQLAVIDVAYRLGFVTAETNLVSVAQLYMISAPYLSAKVLEKGMGDDCGEACIDKEKAKNQKLLGQAHLNAKDFAKAGDPLSLAAEEEENGELFFQLGIVYMSIEEWEEAADTFQKAIKKGDLRQEGEAYIRLGSAYFNMEQFKKAENAFKAARKFPKVRKNAKGWINYISAEKARIRRLAAAGLR